tara:strand:+ start:7681 stop:8499 length:819 start_codon:yes stop_codon:yes gene_type:complete
MKKNRSFYFDMDGTLTRHRMQIKPFMIKKLMKLSDYGKINVISGSKSEDIFYQLEPLFTSLSDMHLNRISLMPCNGTKLFFFHSDRREWLPMHVVDMSNRLDLQFLYRAIIKCQHMILSSNDYLGAVSISPDFIDYRGSLINWCPIGRSATISQRNKFIELDKEKNIRDYMRNLLQSLLLPHRQLFDDIEIAKGGQTSLDMYPLGWDKTYGLRHFSSDDHWFIGDACKEGQNDHQIYQNVKNKNGQAFETSGPIHTGKIIDEIIVKIKNKEN